MIEFLDTSPDTDVLDGEYLRLLGFPRGYQPDPLARDRADQARAWYASHGRPWVYARQLSTVAVTNGSILLDGQSFSSPRLRSLLLDSAAHTAVIAAVSAGPQIEAHAHELWIEEKPDEYFFHEILGSAVVEHLVTRLGARLCAWADPQHLAVLPHYSPGYREWDVAQQPRLLELIRRGASQPIPPFLESLDTGMLRPKKSLLAVFPITRELARTRHLTTLIPCQNCSYAPCQYRRAPYGRGLAASEIALPAGDSEQQPSSPTLPLTPGAKYHTNVKALARWSAERLALSTTEDGQVLASFRYEGSTCASTGRPLIFLYHVTLSPRADRYRILSLTAAPAAEDTGHQHMCRYQTQGPSLLTEIAADKPLLDQPLDNVLAWPRPTFAATCYCDPASRAHKWGLVLETLHYALVQRDKELAGVPARAIQ